ncbi:MAG: hypothetical protein R3B72_42410 [Polyangiaceae bacterium]
MKLRALLPSLLIACGPTLEPPATVAIPPLGQDGPAPSASTSRSGSEAWLRSLPCDGWATVGAITRTPSGDILVLGTCSTFLDARGQTRRGELFLTALDLRGEPRWHRDIGDLGATIACFPADLVVAPDGTIYAAGTIDEDGCTVGGHHLRSEGYGDAFVVALDPNGEVQAVKQTRGGSSNYSPRIAVARDGDVLFGVMYQEGMELMGARRAAPRGGAVLARLDRNLEPVWTSFFTRDGAFIDALAATPHGWLVGGSFIDELVYEDAHQHNHPLVARRPGRGRNAFLVALDGAGKAPLWSRHWISEEASVIDLEVTAEGASYALLSFYESLDEPSRPGIEAQGRHDIALVATTANGRPRWLTPADHAYEPRFLRVGHELLVTSMFFDDRDAGPNHLRTFLERFATDDGHSVGRRRFGEHGWAVQVAATYDDTRALVAGRSQPLGEGGYFVSLLEP